MPPGVLYRVKATYKYNKEDVDELSFEVGDTIRVVEYDDPEEQVNKIRLFLNFFTFVIVYVRILLIFSSLQKVNRVLSFRKKFDLVISTE